MNETQRTEAVRALDGVLLQLYPALIALRRANPSKLESEAGAFRDGLRLAADALENFFDSTPMRVLRFVLRERSDSDLPGAVAELRDALATAAAEETIRAVETATAWNSFVRRLAQIEILVDEIPIGSPFDPSRHDAVAGSGDGINDTVREVLTPGLVVHGLRIVCARVRTGPKPLA